MSSDPPAARHVIGSACRERFLGLEAPSARRLRDLGIVMAGVSDLARPYEMMRPAAGFHVVILTLAGAGVLHAPGRGARLGAGEMLVLPAGAPHHYGIDGDAWRICWFHLARCDGLGQSLLGSAPVVRPAHHLAQLLAAAEGCLREARADDQGARRAAELHAELLANYLERDLAEQGQPRIAEQRRRLQRLWDEVDRDLRHPWSVEALARRAQESRSSLHRICARHFRTTPLAMVTRLRMERARQLLRETDEPLKRIADHVGYRDEFAFSSAFKRVMGASPRAFRDQDRRTS